MNKTFLKMMQAGFLGVLILNIGLCGCITGDMWDSHNPETKKVTLSHIKDHRFSIMVLSDERIALLPIHKHIGALSQLATIYKFQNGTYEAIKQDIKKVTILEQFELSSQNQSLKKQGVYFTIELNTGKTLNLEFVDATMTERSNKELVFDDPRIDFQRTVTADKRNINLTWLWKIPLTPLTLAVDVCFCLYPSVWGSGW
jgi:hypothetical protein